jgi:chromosome segregation ATPase
MQNSYGNHTLEVDSLRALLKETREKLANEVQERLELRKEYELRLTEFAVSHDRIQKELKNVVAQREKEIEGHTSKASLTHISHNQLLQTRNIDMKQIMAEKRTLEGHIAAKNREIEALNLKVQQMLGLHRRDMDKLEEEIDQLKEEHKSWLGRQEKETAEWHQERSDLNAKIEDLNAKIAALKKQHHSRETELTAENNQKGLEIARLQGVIAELESKVKQLASKGQV